MYMYMYMYTETYISEKIQCAINVRILILHDGVREKERTVGGGHN